MLVLVYRKCSTCQKALKWLEEHQVVFDECPIWKKILLMRRGKSGIEEADYVGRGI